MVNICVPVLKRYDLLRGMILSLAKSTVKPNMVLIIDNGRNAAMLSSALVGDVPIKVHTPAEPLSIAASWNWFIQNAAEERVIVNDDIVFAPDSLRKLLEADAELVWAAGCGFSCYVIRDGCVKKIGLFDEEISPGYGYYEDDDYLQRLDGRGTREPSAKAMNVECGVIHRRSQTLAASTREEVVEHHRKFRVAQYNYMKKWGIKSLD